MTQDVHGRVERISARELKGNSQVWSWDRHAQGKWHSRTYLSYGSYHCKHHYHFHSVLSVLIRNSVLWSENFTFCLVIHQLIDIATLLFSGYRFKTAVFLDFPGGPMVKTPRFACGQPSSISISDQGIKTPHVTVELQKNNKNEEDFPGHCEAALEDNESACFPPGSIQEAGGRGLPPVAHTPSQTPHGPH